MKIAIKYCGGCNPRIKRKKIVKKVKKKFNDYNFEIFDPQEKYDLILAINGCHVACGLSNELKEKRNVIVVGGFKLRGQKIKNEEKLIEKIVKDIDKF